MCQYSSHYMVAALSSYESSVVIKCRETIRVYLSFMGMRKEAIIQMSFTSCDLQGVFTTFGDKIRAHCKVLLGARRTSTITNLLTFKSSSIVKPFSSLP